MFFSKYVKCPNCQYEGQPKKFIKGSIIIEILLWILGIIPGLIYTLWRRSTKYEGCPKCKFANIYEILKPKKELSGN